jgi:hypothetical protein
MPARKRRPANRGEQTIEFLSAGENAKAEAHDQHEQGREHQGRDVQAAPLCAAPRQRRAVARSFR